MSEKEEHMNTTHKPLTYTITNEHLDQKIDDRDEYFDLVCLGSLLNVISFAQKNGAHYQLASFAFDLGFLGDDPYETIYLTGGLLFDAFVRMERLVEKYDGEPFVESFDEMLDFLSKYKPPEVMFEIRNCGPFAIVNEERTFSTETQKLEIMPFYTLDHKGFAIARIADEIEVSQQYKRTGEPPETHQTLESVINYLIDEFTIGAREFIHAISKRLGLKPVEQQRTEELPLAP
jgi:hypothetical protein